MCLLCGLYLKYNSDQFYQTFELCILSVIVARSMSIIVSPCTRIHETHNPYPTAFPYGNGMVLHFYQQQESSTTKTVHKVINKGLKAYVQSPHTGENFH